MCVCDFVGLLLWPNGRVGVGFIDSSFIFVLSPVVRIYLSLEL